MEKDIDYAIERISLRAWELRFNTMALALKNLSYGSEVDKRTLEEASYYEQVAEWLTELKEIKSKTDPTKEEKLITENLFSRWKEALKENIEAWLNMDKYYHPNSKEENIPISELMDIIDNTKEA